MAKFKVQINFYSRKNEQNKAGISPGPSYNSQKASCEKLPLKTKKNKIFYRFA